MSTIKESFSTIVSETFFTYRGVIVERLVGGYRVLNKKVKSIQEVDDVIDQSKKIISESTKKGSH